MIRRLFSKQVSSIPQKTPVPLGVVRILRAMKRHGMMRTSMNLEVPKRHPLGVMRRINWKSYEKYYYLQNQSLIPQTHQSL